MRSGLRMEDLESNNTEGGMSVNTAMDKDLGFLTEDEIESLMQRYYAGEAVSKLAKEYNITVRASDLYKLFPPEVCRDFTCEYCGEFLVRKRLSKTRNKAPFDKRDLFCPTCGHRPFSEGCNCSHCTELREAHQAALMAQIRETYARDEIPVEFDSLSFREKVFLGAICRSLLKENLYEIMPYQDSDVILTPADEMTQELYTTLIYQRAICVSPDNPVEAFNLESEDFPNRFYTYRTMYDLNLVFPSNKKDLFERILNPTYYSKENKEEALALWKEIAVAECVEYLEYQLNKVGFQFSAGDKTHATFDGMLDTFSVSQIFGIIWRAIADSSRLYLQGGISRRHAANSAIGACERYAERAKINKWDLVQYNRPHDLPQSDLSLFYYNRVLEIGEMGFRVPPTIV